MGDLETYAATGIGNYEAVSLLSHVNVKLSLCLTKHHAIKTYWGSGGIAPRIL